MEVTREQSTPNFLKNRHFLPHDTQSFFTLHLTLHDEGPYHIKTSPLICRANQWAGFYMVGASVMKNLNTLKNLNQAFFSNKNTLRD